MRLQDSAAGCGVAAVCNALEALGNPQPQEVVWTLSGATGTRGTNPKGLMAAVTSLGHSARVLQFADVGESLIVLHGYLLRGMPVILLVDDCSHWVVAVGTLGELVILIDSADGGMVQVLDPQEMCDRWKQSSGKKPFYGLAIGPRLGA